MKEAINYYAHIYNGDWSKIAKAIANHEKYYVIDSKYLFVTIGEYNYPKKLYDLRYPPWIIYYCGNLGLLDMPSISVVGSRIASEYGKYVTEKIVNNNLDKLIVSGLAKGIDSIAHKASINHFTVGVIACGLNYHYPISSDELYKLMKINQLIISEYPIYTKPLKHHFIWRNRIIAALGDVLIVTQAKIASGTSITVNEALEIGRDIYCVPCCLKENDVSGCNHLIGQGAIIISDLDQKF